METVVRQLMRIILFLICYIRVIIRVLTRPCILNRLEIEENRNAIVVEKEVGNYYR